MRNFQDTFERKRPFISSFSIWMTVPLIENKIMVKNLVQSSEFCEISNLIRYTREQQSCLWPTPCKMNFMKGNAVLIKGHHVIISVS